MKYYYLFLSHILTVFSEIWNFYDSQSQIGSISFLILHVTSPNFRNGKTRIMLLSTSELTIFKFAITRRNGKIEVPIETKRIFSVTKELKVQNSEMYFYGSRYYPCLPLVVMPTFFSLYFPWSPFLCDHF